MLLFWRPELSRSGDNAVDGRSTKLSVRPR